MTANPYEPPDLRTVEQGIRPVLRMAARVAIVVYGLAFSAFCVVSTIDDFVNRDPIAETLFWILISVTTCYGIFALAIPALRVTLVVRTWRYVAYVLPVLVYAATGWEIRAGERMGTIELVLGLALFLVITTPAFVFNFLLHWRLRAREHAT